MSMYGAVRASIGVYKEYQQRTIDDSLRAVDNVDAFDGNPQELGTILKQNQDYMNLASEILNQVLKTASQLQI